MSLSVVETFTAMRIPFIFEERALCMIRKSTSGTDCCKSLLHLLKQHQRSKDGKALVFYVHVSKFTLDMRKLVPPQVVYYQYCIGGRVVLCMLHDETKRKRGLNIVK